jgi:hypothetical protein
MWQVFYLIKEAFYRDAADYFAGESLDRMINFILLLFRNYELFA